MGFEALLTMSVSPDASLFALNLSLEVAAHKNWDCVVCDSVMKYFVLFEPRPFVLYV